MELACRTRNRTHAVFRSVTSRRSLLTRHGGWIVAVKRFSRVPSRHLEGVRPRVQLQRDLDRSLPQDLYGDSYYYVFFSSPGGTEPSRVNLAAVGNLKISFPAKAMLKNVEKVDEFLEK